MPVSRGDAIQMDVRVTRVWFVMRFPPIMMLVFTGLITAYDGENKT